MFTYAFQQSTSVLPIKRKWWLHVETGCPNDRDTLLFHLPPALRQCCLPLLSVSVYNITMSMCYACEGSVTACFPLSYHSCPTHTLHPVRLPANKRERESQGEREVRKRAGETRKGRGGGGGGLEKVRAEHRSGVKLQKVRSEQLFVLPCVPMVSSPLGAAYLQSTVQERVCHLDLDGCECDGGGWCYCDFITVTLNTC